MSEECTEKSPRIIITDRYDSLGIPRPDPKTCCDGQCEGTGHVPVYDFIGNNSKGAVSPVEETDPALRALWKEAEAKEPSNDGWHFLTCPDCGGTGRIKDAGSVWKERT